MAHAYEPSLWAAETGTSVQGHFQPHRAMEHSHGKSPTVDTAGGNTESRYRKNRYSCLSREPCRSPLFSTDSPSLTPPKLFSLTYFSHGVLAQPHGIGSYGLKVLREQLPPPFPSPPLVCRAGGCCMGLAAHPSRDPAALTASFQESYRESWKTDRSQQCSGVNELGSLP